MKLTGLAKRSERLNVWLPCVVVSEEVWRPIFVLYWGGPATPHWPWGVMVPIGLDPPPEFLFMSGWWLRTVKWNYSTCGDPCLCRSAQWSALYSGAVPEAEFIFKNGATESQITTAAAPSWCWSEFRVLCPTASQLSLTPQAGRACCCVDSAPYRTPAFTSCVCFVLDQHHQDFPIPLLLRTWWGWGR